MLVKDCLCLTTSYEVGGGSFLQLGDIFIPSLSITEKLLYWHIDINIYTILTLGLIFFSFYNFLTFLVKEALWALDKTRNLEA